MASEDPITYDPSPPGASRRRFLKLGLAAGGVVAAGVLAGRLLFGSPQGPSPTHPGGGAGEEADILDTLNSAVTSGGPPKDGIPSIDTPKFVSRSRGDELFNAQDIVFGIEVDGDVRAYPQRVLVWHEIVNDRFGDRALAITYCPLTGSQIAVEGRSPAGGSVTFGTTGKLVNSNLLMYDRQTDSTWPQIFGRAISGNRRGETLSERPLVWTTWDQWRTAHPDTVILSKDTGFFRNYSSDPYGSYHPVPSAYYADSNLWFPVLHRSDRFPAKKVFFGIRHSGESLAVPLAEFSGVGADTVRVGGLPVGLFYDGELAALRAYESTVDEQALSFTFQNGRIVDAETQSVWSPEGVGLEGSFAGTSLRPVSGFNVMWFAWYAFYPETTVYQ